MWLTGAPLFYCLQPLYLILRSYELQVAKNSQNCGLGKALMQKLSNIGSKWGMRKIMLTILKANTSAMKFYLAIGCLF